MKSSQERSASHREDRFTERVVVVTGAAGGLGAAIALAFLREGARVVVCDIDDARLHETIEDGDVEMDRVHAVHCDASEKSDVQALAAEAQRTFGRIDVLVNNAGVSTVAPITELSEVAWERVFAVNAKGVFLGCQAVLPMMLAQKSGAIVNVASQAGLRAKPLISHYCAAKAAIIHFTRVLALEAAPHVRANAVCPGLVETGMVREAWEDYAAETGTDVVSIREERRASIPLQRFQQPTDIAAAVLFLASDNAAQITGHALDVTGGESIA